MADDKEINVQQAKNLEAARQAKEKKKVEKESIPKDFQQRYAVIEFFTTRPSYCIHWQSRRFELGKCSQEDLRTLYVNGFTQFIHRR